MEQTEPILTETLEDPGGLPVANALIDLLNETRPEVEACALFVALARLRPDRAADWLERNASSIRDRWSERALADGLEELVRALDRARAPDTHAAVLDAVLPFRDVASGDVVSRLLAGERAEALGDGVRSLLECALEREPAHAGLLRLAVDLADAGDTSRTHELLDQLARVDYGHATLHRVWRARSALPTIGGTPVRVAVLGSFTVDPLVPYMDLHARGVGLEPEVYVGPFDTWAQEVIDPSSGLRRFDPEITFLFVSVDDLVPDLAGAPSEADLRDAGGTAVGRVLAAAEAFASWSEGTLVVHGFHSAFGDPWGVAAGSTRPSRRVWLDGLNHELAAGLKPFPRAHLLDTIDVLLRRRGGALDNAKMRHLAAMRLGEGALDALGREWVRYMAPLKGLTRKCVVVDLDNTLWGGIVGEDGLHGIKLGHTSPGSEYQEFQRYLRSLTERGFLLAVNSKNNPADALEVFRTHEEMILKEDDFSAMRINWMPKPENIRAIAEELNIGIDSLIFVDDNPDERELMRQLYPEVLTPELPRDPSLYRAALETLPELQVLQVTEADRTRVAQYRAKKKREETRVTAGSIEDYLRSLDIHVGIGPASEATIPRVHQMFSRTNQFNLTTRRYDAGQLETFASSPDSRLWILSAGDRFGDHGIVATALARVDGPTWTLDSFLMSCRVIGYGVETALLSVVCDAAKSSGATTVVGELIETRKNVPAREFYADHGFTKVADPVVDAGGQAVHEWKLDLVGSDVRPPDWIRVEVRDVP